MSRGTFASHSSAALTLERKERDWGGWEKGKAYGFRYCIYVHSVEEVAGSLSFINVLPGAVQARGIKIWMRGSSGREEIHTWMSLTFLADATAVADPTILIHCNSTRIFLSPQAIHSIEI